MSIGFLLTLLGDVCKCGILQDTQRSLLLSNCFAHFLAFMMIQSGLTGHTTVGKQMFCDVFVMDNVCSLMVGLGMYAYL